MITFREESLSIKINVYNKWSESEKVMKLSPMPSKYSQAAQYVSKNYLSVCFLEKLLKQCSNMAYNRRWHDICHLVFPKSYDLIIIYLAFIPFECDLILTVPSKTTVLPSCIWGITYILTICVWPWSEKPPPTFLPQVTNAMVIQLPSPLQ